MTPDQRTRQMQAVHIQFKKMVADGSLAEESVHVWASVQIGRVISTLTACGDFELNALRDILNGKPPKIHEELRRQLQASKKNPDSYVNWLMHNAPAYARYRDSSVQYIVETLPLVEAYRMLKQEEVRGRRTPARSQPASQQSALPRRGPQIGNEQATLWGM